MKVYDKITGNDCCRQTAKKADRESGQGKQENQGKTGKERKREMNQVILWIMAAGAAIGGIDRIFGNRLGLGNKFEDGFMYMGSMALSMVGMICLAPVLAQWLGKVIVPVYQTMGIDPAMFGGILAIDMGGYPLAEGLAKSPVMGQYAGIVVSAIFGCTLVFTIPVGMELTPTEGQETFAKGIMIGLATMPVGLLIGALVCGLSAGQALHQNLPVFVLAALLIAGLYKVPAAMVKGFQIFARIIKIVITIGLVLAALQYMIGRELLPGMAPIEEALATVSSIAVMLLGSLPLAELLLRAMRKPFGWLGRRLGISSQAIAGLMVSVVSVLPAIVMLKDMDRRGQLINVAYMVSSASLLAAHLGFTIAAEPDMLPALIAAKLGGAVAALAAALLISKRPQ